MTPPSDGFAGAAADGLTAVYTEALGREVRLRPDTSDAQVWADTFTGLYHLPPAEVFAARPPMTVLDLGANIGLTAAHYKALWPDARVVAIEMDPESAQLAELNAPDVTVRCHAVSALGGWGSYDRNARAEAYAFRPGDRHGNLVSSYTLRQVILRSFASQAGPDGSLRTARVDLVKMDIEGSEWSLFDQEPPDSWAPLVRHLLVEMHPTYGLPDDSGYLVALARSALDRLGFHAVPSETHPRGVWAWRP